MTITFEGPAGRIEGLLDLPERLPDPERPRALVVFAHPLPTEGGTMHTKVVFQGAKALARTGCAVVRFNFRGVGGSAGAFDRGRGEIEDFRAAVDHAASRYPKVSEIWAAGFSFGAYVALAEGAGDDRVRALIGISPPIARYDFSALERSSKPKFFIQGEFDELCPLAALRSFYAKLPEPKDLVVIDAADHLYEGKVSQVAEALEDLLSDFSTGVGPAGAQ
jgi:alpha/beta superfamily hydrolase